MLELLGRIFATPKTVEKTVDAAIKAGDKVWFTAEEKAEHQQILAEWYLRYLEATQPQALARRILAFLIGFLWASLVVVGVIFALINTPDMALRSSYVFQILNNVVNMPFTSVVIFYFGGHYLKEVLRQRNGK